MPTLIFDELNIYILGLAKLICIIAGAMLTILLASAILLLFIKYKLSRRKLEQLAKHIPASPCLTVPLLGNALAFVSIKTVGDICRIMDTLAIPGAPIQKFWFGPKLFIALSDPVYIDTVLSNAGASDKAACYKAFHCFANGIFSSNGRRWQMLRKPLNKLFHISIIENSSPIFSHQALTLTSKLEKKVGKGYINIYDYVKYCTLDIICASHTGVGPDFIKEQVDNRYDAPLWVEKGIRIAFKRIIKPQLYIDTIFNMTSEGKKSKIVKKNFGKFSNAIVQERLAILNKQKEETIKGSPKCYTDILINNAAELGAPLDNLGVVLNDFLIGGFDTTAVTISSALVYLAMYPEYQEKAYKEQFEIFGNSDREITYEDLSGMSYLDMVFRETLRLSGPIGIVRDLKCDIKLDDKYTLPAGSSAYIIFAKLHRNPDFWQSPERFYPDHFLPENVAKRPKKTFIPFSVGPRGCPGEQYGRVSCKFILAAVIRKFKLTTKLTEDTIKFKFCLMLENANGYPVELHYR